MAELRWVKLECYSMGLLYEPPKQPDHNLGFAIFVVAIEDYCRPGAEIHADARDFLFPPTAEWQDQFDWAVSLAEGLNPGWLRSELDRCRGTWDVQRNDHLASKSRRQRLRMGRKANERKTSVEPEQTAIAVRGDRLAV
jgi:hypothetical protein